jgi:hypothetical protein
MLKTPLRMLDGGCVAAEGYGGLVRLLGPGSASDSDAKKDPGELVGSSVDGANPF